MTIYSCKRCSNAEDGTFVFTVDYMDNPKLDPTTRCPSCGALKSSQDVVEWEP